MIDDVVLIPVKNNCCGTPKVITNLSYFFKKYTNYFIDKIERKKKKIRQYFFDNHGDTLL